jgi:DnaJ-class molecular chaperone
MPITVMCRNCQGTGLDVRHGECRSCEGSGEATFDELLACNECGYAGRPEIRLIYQGTRETQAVWQCEYGHIWKQELGSHRAPFQEP